MQRLLQSGLGALLLLLIIAIAIWVAYYVPAGARGTRYSGMTAPQLVFLIEIGLVLLYLMIVGTAITGRLGGVLIDSRNRYSLSQMNAAVWTAVIVAGMFAAGLANLATGATDPFAVMIRTEVFLAAGIVATTLAATPIVRSNKRVESRRLPVDDGLARIGKLQVGKIIENANPKSAAWADLFEGEEANNYDRPDLGRIQLFYFTALAVGAYVVLLFTRLGAGVPARVPGTGCRAGRPHGAQQRGGRRVPGGAPQFLKPRRFLRLPARSVGGCAAGAGRRLILGRCLRLAKSSLADEWPRPHSLCGALG